MKVFDYKNYKKFVIERIHSMPKRGYGQYRKMANFLSINSVNVTQIFKGARHLTVEQACQLEDFFGLTELESQYFVGLVELERAGHFKLKQMIQMRLNETLEKSQSLNKRLSVTTELTETAKGIFYSSWYYSAIRLSTSLPELNNSDAIAEYFNIPLSIVNKTLEFLIANGLCLEEKGQLRMGPSSTHLSPSSPHIARHHCNWRNKSIQKADFISTGELSLTMPCSLSKKAFEQIRKDLIDAIEKATHNIDQGPEEQLACLNIDWFKL